MDVSNSKHRIENLVTKFSKIDESEFEKLVDEMISLNKQLGNFKGKITEEAKRIEEQIKRIDNEIDEAVYSLYGITLEERKIIESADNSFL